MPGSEGFSTGNAVGVFGLVLGLVLMVGSVPLGCVVVAGSAVFGLGWFGRGSIRR